MKYFILPKVELAMAYGCQVSQEQVLQYIHYNRHHNTMLIERNMKLLTNEFQTEIDTMKAFLGVPSGF